jgi:hypothetical protein
MIILVKILLAATCILLSACANNKGSVPSTRSVSQTGLMRSRNGTLYRVEDAPPGSVPAETQVPVVASAGKYQSVQRQGDGRGYETSRGKRILFGALMGLAAGANAYNQAMAANATVGAPYYQVPLYQPSIPRTPNFGGWGSRGATYTRSNNFVYGPDGVHQKVGNYWYHPDGTTTNKVGNFYYHSDGGTTQKVGNYWYHPDGTTTNKVGNFYYHSDGTTSQQIGNTIYRN